MFSVTGTLNGEHYAVVVGAKHSTLGIVSGTDNIMELLVRREGEHYAATPTGPFGQLDCRNPASVFGALLGWTTVRKVHGKEPKILGSRRPPAGAVY
jgi:hypothetical protein